ncbi:hypothetical protein AZE42_12559, partial [Rhizopogon vesiculosus]
MALLASESAVLKST